MTLPFDPLCKKEPSELNYAGFKTLDQTDDEYVMAEEGTYDPASGFFLCDDCYLRSGQPSGSYPNRWTATPENLRMLFRKVSRRAVVLVNPRKV